MSDTPTKHDRTNPPAQRPAAAKKRPRRLRTMLALGFIGLWVAVLVGWLALGNPGAWGNWLVNLEFSDKGSAPFGGKSKHPIKDPSELNFYGDGKAELGDFSVKIFDPLTRSSLRSDFHLEGNTVFDDPDDFREFMQSNHRLFREQIMVAVHSATCRSWPIPTCDCSKRSSSRA